MSQEQIDALVARLNSDAGFASALGAAASPDDAVRIAADHGFTLTAGELAGANAERELDDAELEGVSGGGSMINTECGQPACGWT